MSEIPIVNRQPDPDLGLEPKFEMFKLKIHELDVEDFIPNGDRYVVEAIEIDENVEFGQLLVVTNVPVEPKPGDQPWKKPSVEARGCFAAVICTVGDGHLLGYPDWPQEVLNNAYGGEALSGFRDRATVPMFFKKGQIVLVDYNAKGRNLKILGKHYRVVNQIDILTSIPRIQLERVEGVWREVQPPQSEGENHA